MPVSRRPFPARRRRRHAADARSARTRAVGRWQAGYATARGAAAFHRAAVTLQPGGASLLNAGKQSHRLADQRQTEADFRVEFGPTRQTTGSTAANRAPRVPRRRGRRIADARLLYSANLSELPLGKQAVLSRQLQRPNRSRKVFFTARQGREAVTSVLWRLATTPTAKPPTAPSRFRLIRLTPIS